MMESVTEAIDGVRRQLDTLAERAEGPEAAKFDQMSWILADAIARIREVRQ